MKRIVTMACVSVLAAGAAYGISWVNTTYGVLEDPDNWWHDPQPAPPALVAPDPAPDPEEIPDGLEEWELEEWLSDWWIQNGYDDEETLEAWKEQWVTDHYDDHVANWLATWNAHSGYSYSYFYDSSTDDIVIGGHRDFYSWVAQIGRPGTTTFALDTGIRYWTEYLWVYGPANVVVTNGILDGPNQFILYGGSTVVASGSNAMVRGNGNAFTIGQGGSGSCLIASNGASIEANTGVTVAGSYNQALFSGSNTTFSGIGTVGGSFNTWTAEDQADLYAGAFNMVGTSNVTLVSDGAKMVVGGGRLTVNGNGNRLVVSNSTASFIAQSYFHFGNGWSVDNAVEVRDGAYMYAGGLLAGWYPGPLRNTVLVTDPGSRFEARGSSFEIGGGADECSLIVTNGGWAYGDACYIGYDTHRSPQTAYSNRVVVTGAGSALDVGNFRIGDAGGGYNEFHVLDGGRATMNGFHIGLPNHGNHVVVKGGFVTNYSSMVIGSGGMDNSVVVDDGVLWNANHANVGIGGAATGNKLRVANDGFVRMGTYTYGAQSLMVANAGRVEIACATNTALRTEGCFSLTGSSALRYELGKAKPAEDVPLVMTVAGGSSYLGYNVTIWVEDEGHEDGGYWQEVAAYEWYNSFRNDGTAILEIDARQLALAGSGRVALLDADGGSEAALIALANAADWGGGDWGTLEVDPAPGGRRRLVATVYNKAGTMMLLR